MKRIIVIAGLLSVLLSVNAQSSANDKKTVPAPEAPVVTQGTVTISGKPITYTATTGYMQLQDKDGVAKANMFYVSYAKNAEPNVKKRPVTFVFNGGPGSASAWLHMGALGPKKIVMTADGNAQKPPYSFVNNDNSWLDLTDLVFIDPVGTGFSKPVDGEKPEQFYGFDNDVKAISDFIRLWTNKNNRWGSPKYLAGESYGTTRACGVVQYLMEEYGMYFNGISLISCALDFQTLREFEGNDLPYICYLPAYTLLAQYHKVIPQNPELQAKAEAFALQEYSVALLKGDALPKAKKQEIAQTLEQLTGVSAQMYVDHNLRIPSWQFRKYLLDTANLIIGRYDGRLTMTDPLNSRDYADDDPSFNQIAGAFSTAFNEYVRTDLKYVNDLPFYLIGDVSPWKYGDGKYLQVTDNLRAAMFQNPSMKVFVANGMYDLATSYFGTQYAFNHMNLPEQLQSNISLNYYKAGHMMYFLDSEIQKLKKDVTKMYVQ